MTRAGHLLATLFILASATGATVRGEGAAKANAVKLPADAVAAMGEFDEAVKRADAERDVEVRDARAALKTRLEAAVKSETRKGNLDVALAVRNALKEVEPTAGVWLISWSTGGTYRYDLGRDTAVAYEAILPPATPKALWTAGKLVRKGETLTFRVTSDGSNDVYRCRAAGPYLIAELWRGEDQFEQGARPLGVGVGRRPTIDPTRPDDAKADAGRLPRDVVSARRAFAEAMKRVDSQRDTTVQTARAALSKRLGATVKSETLKGNLDGAIAVRDALKTAGAAINGAWLITWSSGETYRYEVSKDGARWAVEGGTKMTKVERSGDTRTYWLAGPGGNHVHRYRPAGDYLVTEAWPNAAAFERAESQSRSARRSRPRVTAAL